VSADAAAERRKLVQDILRYLEQRREDGMVWFLDPGATAADDAAPDAGAGSRGGAALTAPPEPSRDAPPRSQNSPEPPRDAAPASRQPARVDAANERSDRASGDGFAQECAAFVEETCARIARHRTAAPVQADIFASGEPDEPVLDGADKARALADLAAEVAPCRLCKLHAGRTQTVFGVGNPDANVVFVGEAPGRDEDLQGEPFVGRAGKLLNDILKAIDFARDDVYICNILKCRPPQNRDPEADEVAACEPYLKRQLAILKPRIIVCLGRVAAQTLLGTRASLSALRQSVHFYEGIPVMATYHPAALLRNPHWKRPTWDDVRKLRALDRALAEG
jgi:DNA polymerase